MDKKTQWPECVGKSGKEAEQLIKTERPEVETIILPVGTPVTKDYRATRVRIFVDDKGNVTDTPHVG